jgi:hypothetical protein
MQILEELGTFIVSLVLALAVLGVAAVMLYYFNPQQPLDHAKAAFYPLVKPINATHVWLGVKPSADKVGGGRAEVPAQGEVGRRPRCQVYRRRGGVAQHDRR